MSENNSTLVPSNNQDPIIMKMVDVVYREDLYPRLKSDPVTIQRYAENLDVLPPIEVNQHGILIDGFHRWTAHRVAQSETIRATITTTASEAEVYALAIERNAEHGLPMNEADKKSCAIRLYNAGTGIEKDKIARLLSVSVRTITNYLERIDHDLREERKQKILALWLDCYTQDEIAAAVGISRTAIEEQLPLLTGMEDLPKASKVSAEFADADFTIPLYNVWPFRKEKTNEVNHFGNSEPGIIDNLLYLYTQPFDIVVDPFAGNGSTLDVCRKRSRRCWASDRKPIIAREKEIRKHDLIDSTSTGGIALPPLNKRWSDVRLTYLDPPYWRQSAGQYSDDPEDFANMPLDRFTQTLAALVKAIASRQSRGAIALLIQPTQWSADGREYNDHVTDLVREVDPGHQSRVDNKRLVLENRVSCPYQSQQYNAQQVDWAKDNRKLLVLTRELIIWRIRA